ncbi:MAG: thermonuclease family protein [Gammaproteobacteria bacterium]|nr:thermonuclease family protein [Gammaproteobacteria bacterium]
MYKLKRALNLGALFCPLVYLWLPLPAQASILCPASAVDETAIVRGVTDGDTLRLEDGRKVRLIGINSPELARDNRQAQPLANEAKQTLYRLLAESGNRVNLQYGNERFDTYRRTLAHIYLTDGRSIQALLLEQGMATAYTTPPNADRSDCYRRAEQQAMQQRRGLWALSEYQAKTLSQLGRQEEGFRLIRGRVSRIERSSGASWIMLNEKLKIRIASNDLIYFRQSWLQSLPGKQIEVRGWLHPEQNRYFMQLRHPDAVQLLDTTPAAAK